MRNDRLGRSDRRVHRHRGDHDLVRVVEPPDADPAEAVRRGGRTRLTVVGLILAATGLLVTAGLRDTLTYYRTPGEVLTDPAHAGSRIRLGGQVVPGSIRHQGTEIFFRLAGDGKEIAIVQRGAAPDTFRDGEEAVVEGVLDSHGVFRSDTVLVRHGNEYRATPPSPSPKDLG